MAAMSTPVDENLDWTIRAYRPGDEEALVTLFAQVFGRPITAAHWHWKLKTRPADFETVWLAVTRSADRPVFHYGGIAHRFRLAGEEVSVVHAVDAMAAPDFRRQGMLTRVAGFAQEQWREAGVRFTTGMPNEKWGSRAKALGWQPLFPLHWIVQPLRPETYLARYSHLPGMKRLTITGRLWRAFWRRRFAPDPVITVQPVDHAGSEFDEMWRRFAPESRFAIVRDAAWVNWRYLQAPSFDYRVLLAVRDQQPVGYLVYRLDTNNGRRVGLIPDFLAAKDDRATQATLLHQASARLLAAGAETAVSQAVPGSWLMGVFRHAGFLASNKAFTVQIVPLASDLPLEELRQPGNWHMGGGDFDVM